MNIDIDKINNLSGEIAIKFIDKFESMNINKGNRFYLEEYKEMFKSSVAVFRFILGYDNGMSIEAKFNALSVVLKHNFDTDNQKLIEGLSGLRNKVRPMLSPTNDTYDWKYDDSARRLVDFNYQLIKIMENAGDFLTISNGNKARFNHEDFQFEKDSILYLVNQVLDQFKPVAKKNNESINHTRKPGLGI